MPGKADATVIKTTAAAISIQSRGSLEVQSITTAADDTLSITNGSLTVTPGESALSEALSMTRGSLTASGAGKSLTDDGKNVTLLLERNGDASSDSRSRPLEARLRGLLPVTTRQMPPFRLDFGLQETIRAPGP